MCVWLKPNGQNIVHFELHSQSQGSNVFLLANTTEADPLDTVRVISKPCPRVQDKIRRRNVEDVPVTARLRKRTAAMVTLGMPSQGWLIGMNSSKCPCPFSMKHGSCVHYAMECCGTMNLNGRRTLVNRGISVRKNVQSSRGHPRKNGAALEME